MISHQFEALGTQWHLTVDAQHVEPVVFSQIIAETATFERRFSRFLPNSEVLAFAQKPAGTYGISDVLAELLAIAQSLKESTSGRFDPCIAPLLESIGYNASYSFTANEAAQKHWKPTKWQVTKNQLTIDGPISFDLGGIAKGYWIDQVSQLLTTSGYPHHLVDGGGDLFGTTKATGEPWRIAVEWPGKPDVALAVLHLQHQGFAASDVFRRRWGSHHHLLNAQTSTSANHILGACAVHHTAFLADALTAQLCQLSEQETLEQTKLPGYQQKCPAFIALYQENRCVSSRSWPWEDPAKTAMSETI